MILLDASALLALILGEPGMETVARILRGGRAAITTVNLAEAYDVASRRESLPAPQVEAVVEPLLEGPLEPVPVSVSHARRAATIRAEHYHRVDNPLSLADTVLLAAAQQGDEIASADSDVLTTAAKLGIGTIELPRAPGAS